MKNRSYWNTYGGRRGSGLDAIVKILETTTHFDSKFEMPDWAKDGKNEKEESKKADVWYCPKCGYRNQGFQSVCSCGAKRG